MPVKTKIIGSKKEAVALLMPLLNSTLVIQTESFAQKFYETFLLSKIRFPVLEKVAEVVFEKLPADEQEDFLDAILSYKTIGGNVIAGKILQLRLERYYVNSFVKAEGYIISGNEWFVCDIIGERVFGHALLTRPNTSLKYLAKTTLHENKWLVRSVGVAAHYAVKKGLDKKSVEKIFLILLSCGSATDFHTKKGIGWAAKTVAKFHPDLINVLSAKIDAQGAKPWFKSKIKIGLGRSFKYASRYPG